MKIEIIRPTRVDGQSCQTGDVVDTDRKSAELLIALRKAQPAKAKPKAEKAAD